MIKKKALQGSYDADVKELISSSTVKDLIYTKYLKSFLFTMAKKVIKEALFSKNLSVNKTDWKLLYFGLKILNIDATFGFGDK